jgi:peptidoglycan/xylan/chitin deacetylase (PgdA/CDA1 family)
MHEMPMATAAKEVAIRQATAFPFLKDVCIGRTRPSARALESHHRLSAAANRRRTDRTEISVLARSRYVETSRASPTSGHKRTSHEWRDRVDRTKIPIAVCAILVLLIGTADAEQCPPGALGVSRTLVVDPTEHPRVGSMQYPETLPLNDHEVVLTFDDGPLPRYTNPLLETLASECVKATFFMVGQMARAYPSMVRRVYDEGHTVANHTQNHPIRKMSMDQAAREIEGGFESLRKAIGDSQAVSPFFRIPGLLRQKSVEQYLAAHGDMTWSADFLADDWTRINNSEVARRAISRIEARGRGILLLHDIHARTVLALPEILNELKSRGYKVVHVVPAAADRPKTATSAEQWIARPTPEQHTSPSQMRPPRRPPKRGLRMLQDVRFRGGMCCKTLVETTGEP